MSDGKLKCDRTERTDAPLCVTRIRFTLGEALIAPEFMVGSQFIRPMYRGFNQFGLNDGGDAA